MLQSTGLYDECMGSMGSAKLYPMFTVVYGYTSSFQSFLACGRGFFLIANGGEYLFRGSDEADRVDPLANRKEKWVET